MWFQKNHHLENVEEKKFHWFIRRLGVKHQLIADGKNINIKEKWGGKKESTLGIKV